MNPVQAIAPRFGSAAGSTETALTDEQLADARAGFERYLRGKGFSHSFIDEHAEDLMGKANVELARKIERGEEVKNAPGLLIHIAYRRTQNLLEDKSRAPDLVGLEAVAEVADDEDQAPEAVTLDRDRVGKIRAAVARLTTEERKIVALEFFEGMNLSQAARSLGWDESKARRRHKAAMSHLKDLLGVDSSDQIVFDVAFLCWLSIAFGDRIGFKVSRELETIWHRIEDVAVSRIDRAHEIGHRANGRFASDPLTASVASSAGRTAKVCAVALICAVGAGAGVVVVGQNSGGDRPAPAAHGPDDVVRASPRDTRVTEAQRHAIPAAKQKESPSNKASQGQEAQPERRETETRQPTVQEAVPAHASQPPPSEVISTLEETNRPTSGTVEPHLSTGANGAEVGEVAEAGGKTKAIESLEDGRP